MLSATSLVSVCRVYAKCLRGNEMLITIVLGSLVRPKMMEQKVSNVFPADCYFQIQCLSFLNSTNILKEFILLQIFETAKKHSRQKKNRFHCQWTLPIRKTPLEISYKSACEVAKKKNQTHIIAEELMKPYALEVVIIPSRKRCGKVRRTSASV